MGVSVGGHLRAHLSGHLSGCLSGSAVQFIAKVHRAQCLENVKAYSFLGFDISTRMLCAFCLLTVLGDFYRILE